MQTVHKMSGSATAWNNAELVSARVTDVVLSDPLFMTTTQN